MRRSTTRPRRAAALATATVAATALLLTSCSSSGSGSGDAKGGDTNEKITLTVGDFGTFGYQEAGLYTEYMAAHPNITIKAETAQDGQKYWDALTTHLAAGSGLTDIQAVEVGYIAQATSKLGDKFVDLGKTEGITAGAWLPWKSTQATTAKGELIGLGTDIGPMAICYRKDLFQQAGLPTDREAVGQLWAGDWGKFIEQGKAFQAKAPAGTFFTDSASGLFNAVISGESEQYSDSSGKLNVKDSAAVKKAWDLSVAASQAKISAGLRQFQKPWEAAFANAKFATVACPSWMTGIVSKQSGEAGKGKWDIAKAPVAANWGGAFLTVPKAGKHTKAAAALAAWLTAPEQQAKVFTKVGNLPSTSAGLQLPAVQSAKLDYFGDTPTGQIYAAAASSIKPAKIGPDDGTAKTIITDNGILDIEEHGTDPAKAWQTVLKGIADKVNG
ncbi:cellobiose transport system substrate-binding protein [Kitasatospora gansuensis]|uniref:Cellobiose transport system substrate-binding protein n=1 Tax=Kitasatospora gansuensis TaxID=258050 RepID=A0A7W7SEW2_9ACTN|nr:extracellular solute-binding protein [Kitasatospora gansuensis]MBB4949191.1 cellobiose transport system substrate-binding protein [Kitasatospora gansuensis]